MKRVIAITGVSQGLGRAMALDFAEAGHIVVGCARNQGALKQLGEILGPPHLLEAVDLRDEKAISRWAAASLKVHGPPDLLINNAGAIHPLGPLWTMDAEVIDRVLDVNVKGVVHVLRHFLPAMVKKGRGVVVNFSAGWGRYTAPGAAPYCASKWAIEGLTSALSQELPKSMAAVSYWPGTVHTHALNVIYGEAKAANYPSPEVWAKIAVPQLLGIGPADTGTAMTCPLPSPVQDTSKGESS